MKGLEEVEKMGKKLMVGQMGRQLVNVKLKLKAYSIENGKIPITNFRKRKEEKENKELKIYQKLLEQMNKSPQCNYQPELVPYKG